MKRKPYRWIALVYDLAVGRPMGVLHRAGLRLCPPEPGMRVLDVGCGTGLLLERLVRAGCEAHGIDLSPQMLERAQRKLGSRVRLHLGDAAQLPFAEQSFDWVAACMALHEVQPEMREAMLGEMARVVRADGRVLVIDYHPGPIGFPQGWWNKAVTETIEILAGPAHHAGYRRFLGSGGVPAMMARHGLAQEQQVVLGQGIVGLYRMRTIRS